VAEVAINLPLLFIYAPLSTLPGSRIPVAGNLSGPLCPRYHPCAVAHACCADIRETTSRRTPQQTVTWRHRPVILDKNSAACEGGRPPKASGVRAHRAGHRAPQKRQAHLQRKDPTNPTLTKWASATGTNSNRHGRATRNARANPISMKWARVLSRCRRGVTVRDRARRWDGRDNEVGLRKGEGKAFALGNRKINSHNECV
jgi:hypothetical protein